MPNATNFCLVILLFCSAGTSAQDQASIPSVRFDQTSGKIVVLDTAFEKLDAAFRLTLIEKSRSLKVRLNDLEDAPSVLGKTEVDSANKSIWFKPRFSFSSGTELVVEFLPKVGMGVELGKISIPKKDVAVTSVLEIYPTSSVLPENLLKLYVHFSAPMQKGQVYDHVEIIDLKSGTPIELPFLELEQELWSRDGKRLTLLFDPGRIKRGLKPREEMGPIFQMGRSYKFVISKKWSDNNGTPLGKNYEKKIAIGPNDATSPSAKKWTIDSPKLGSQNPLTIKFDKMLDSAILVRAVQIFKDDQQLEFKKMDLLQNELGLKLFPMKSWQAGKYEIRIGSDLEDLCGNRIGRLFDVDLKKGQDANRDSSRKLFFSIK